MSKSDLYRSVAALHIANINQGFLASLGVGFLALMYRAIDEGENSVLITAQADGKIVGFVAGGLGMGTIYRRMLRYWPQLCWTLLPSAFSPRRIWRIVEILRYSSGAGDTALPAAELLSIAVDPAYRGQHRADVLYDQLCEHFTKRGVPAFKIVVGAALAPAHRFYRRMGARAAAEVAVHGGAVSTVYVQALGG
jgi:ribosomal protein S18 acetylase RimI-like enzyme